MTIATNPPKSEILTFAESVFESSKIQDITGIFIKLENEHTLKISLTELEGKVFVYADNIIMGTLEPSESKLYKYCFRQQYRKGMKKHGLTTNEEFIKAAFKSENCVRFWDA